MTNNVQWFGGETRHDLDPLDMFRTLSEEEDIEIAVVIVRRKNGEITYHANIRDKPKVAYLLESFKSLIFSGRM